MGGIDVDHGNASWCNHFLLNFDFTSFITIILTITGSVDEMSVFDTCGLKHPVREINRIQERYAGLSINIKKQYEESNKDKDEYKEFYYVLAFNTDDMEHGGIFTSSTYI